MLGFRLRSGRLEPRRGRLRRTRQAHCQREELDRRLARHQRRVGTGGGKASFQSATSAGTVAWSQEDGKDMLLFVRADGRGSAKLQRVK
jgi:hypothetical protein